jgi:Arylsulfotransferase (ASST)
MKTNIRTAMCRPATRGGCVLSVILSITATAWAGPSIFPTGVIRYDPQRAYNCDVLFSTQNNRTYLIDMNGHVVHEWDKGGFPAKMLPPSLTGGKKGEIGVQLSRVPAGSDLGSIGLVPGLKGAFRDLTFGYVDWHGNTAWEWGRRAIGGAVLQHHDWDPLANGDALILGAYVRRMRRFGNRPMVDSIIYEVNPAGGTVWTWKAADHLAELGFTGRRWQSLLRESSADYLHLNDMEVLGPNHWAASGDRRFAPDNVLIGSRNANFLAIISRRTGRIVWRMGPEFRPPGHPYAQLLVTHRKVPFTLRRLSGAHDAHMIPEGLPGAGDLLVFDNEGEGGYPPAVLPLIAGSRVLQINPVTRRVVWEYTGTKATFFSPFLGSAQRLSNGNTLINEAIWGRFFQVTPDGGIVWEYVSPFLTRAHDDPQGPPIRWVYRIQAVPYDWVPISGPHSQAAVMRAPARDAGAPAAKHFH